MQGSAPPLHIVRFGVFEVDLRAGELRKSGLKVRLQEKPFQVLEMLLEHPGEIVTREELQKKLWPENTFVDFDHSMNTAVTKLREALGDTADNPRFVETLARRGYRFIYPVAPVSPPAAVGAGSARPREGRALPYKLVALVAGLVVATLAVLLGLNVTGLRDHLLKAVGAVREPPLRIQSIAVLPLENLSRDPEQEYFADGMTEELVTYLGRVSALRVISRTSVMQYKGAKKPLAQIARELNVDAIVEGAVLRSGNRVRITAQLIQANPEKHLWADSYERDLRDVLALQGDVAQAIAREVQVKLTPQAQSRLARARPVNPEAYEAYLRGRHFWALNYGEAPEALAYFQKATRLDPTFAPAYGGMALYYTEAGFSQPPKEAFPKAMEAARKALQLDPELAEAHAALGYAKLNYEWDWAGAEREFRKAGELNPGSSDAHWMYAVYLTAMTRFEEAMSEAKRARQVDPFSPMVNHVGAWVSMNARRYDEAIAQFKSTLKIEPGYGPAHFWLANCYTLKGMYPEAYREFKAAGTASGDPVLGYLDAVAGKKKEALKALEALKRTAEHAYVDPHSMAILYCGLGDKDGAFACLEKAYAERSASMPQMKMEPWFDLLCSDPRFQDLLRRMNFPP